MNKVRCPEYQTCSNRDCIHWDEHEPIKFADDSTCAEVESSCLYVTNRCAALSIKGEEHEVYKLEPVPV